MCATIGLFVDMMNFKISRRATPGCRATVMIARKHLLANTRGHRRGYAFGGRRVERAKVPGIARCALEDLGSDRDVSSGAVLRDAPAVGAPLVRDLVRGPICAGARGDHRAAE